MTDLLKKIETYAREVARANSRMENAKREYLTQQGWEMEICPFGDIYYEKDGFQTSLIDVAIEFEEWR